MILLSIVLPSSAKPNHAAAAAGNKPSFKYSYCFKDLFQFGFPNVTERKRIKHRNKKAKLY